MALVGKDPLDPALRRRVLFLAGLLPFFGYLATASAHSFWLDGGEFVAAAIDLDIAHPPGHPIAALLGRLAAYVPIGPLPFRVALAQAACAAIATGLFASAFDTTIRSLGTIDPRIALALGVAGSWLFAGAPGLWLQAVRPEVYALETVLVAVVLERLVHLEASWPTTDVKPLYVAALAFGLGLANHHFMALLILPAAAPTLARVLRARGTRPLWLALAGTLAGLSAYAYLPIRAGTEPPIDLGHPTDLGRFFWVVSARAYQSTSAIEADPLGVRMLDVVVQLVEGLHVLPILLALVGGYALARTPGARRLGWVWGATIVLGIVGRGWLGFVRGNPDAAGYLGPVFAGLAALTATFVGAALVALARNDPKRPSRTAFALAAVSLLLGLLQLRYGATQASLARFHATDDFDELRHRSVPTRSVLALTVPQSVFRHWAVDATDRVRPDVVLFPRPFLSYPGMAERVAERSPDLVSLLRSTLATSEMLAPELQSLAARRPVQVEMDVVVSTDVFDTLAPRGLLYEVVDGGASARDVTESADARHDVLHRLALATSPSLGAPEVLTQETRAQLLWIHYGDALYFAHLGAIAPARVSLARALELAPASLELRALEAALTPLDPDARTPIDVTPFRVGP